MSVFFIVKLEILILFEIESENEYCNGVFTRE